MGKRYEVNYFGPGPIPQTQTPRTYPALVRWLATQRSSHPQSLSRRNKALEAHFSRGSESFTSIISFDASSSVKKVEGGDYRP